MSKKRSDVREFAKKLSEDLGDDLRKEVERCNDELRSMIDVIEEIESAIKESYPDASEEELKLMTIEEMCCFLSEGADEAAKHGQIGVALTMSKIITMISLALDGYEPACAKKGEDDE